MELQFKKFILLPLILILSVKYKIRIFKIYFFIYLVYMQFNCKEWKHIFFFLFFFPNNLTVIKFKDRDIIDSRHRPTYRYANTLQIDTSIGVRFKKKTLKMTLKVKFYQFLYPVVAFISASCIDFWLYLLFFSFLFF